MRDMLIKIMFAVMIVGLLLYPACKKTDLAADDNIFHTWEWTESSGGIAGVVQTPASEGYTQSIKFEQGGLYTRYRNDTVVGNGTYTLTSEESMLDDTVYDMIVFDDGTPKQAIMIVNATQLILREDCFDCFTHTYQR